MERVLRNWDSSLEGLKVLDLPCGNGHSLQILRDLGAKPTGADLFPELSRIAGADIFQVDMTKPLPFKDEEFDLVLCQEGIEHIGNQDQILSEFSRILRPRGRLLLTTPNYSNLKSKLSYLLTESEAFGRIMPPNEIEGVWVSEQEQGRQYFGHVFLTGLLRLRLFGIVSGMKLKRMHSSRVNFTSLWLFPLVYPFAFFFSLKTTLRFQKKRGHSHLAWELFSWMINPKMLLENHLILEFQKEKPSLQSGLHDLNMTT